MWTVYPIRIFVTTLFESLGEHQVKHRLLKDLLLPRFQGSLRGFRHAKRLADEIRKGGLPVSYVRGFQWVSAGSCSAGPA